MHHIDLEFAVDKHKHLMKVSRTEQILREIRRKKKTHITPIKASPSPEKMKPVVAASEARPA